jgi:hypothetical protein
MRMTSFGGAGMRATLTAILAMAILGNVPALTGQTKRHSRPQRRWEISVTSGGSRGGSAPAIATAMTAAGLNQTLPAGCFLFGCWADTPYPTMQRGERTTTLALGYRLRPWLTLLLQRNTADLGETAGYRFPLEWLTLRQWVTSYSTVAMVNAGVLHAGVGPAIHRLAVIREEYQPTAATLTRIGMTVHAGLMVPAHTRLFAEVALQYQLVGSMAFGPLAADSATTLARTKASFDYHTLKVGVGFRL